MRALLRVIAVLLAAGATLVVIPTSPAHADNGCPGTRDVWRPYKDSSGQVAAVLQWYDTADGGCINLVSKGSYSGVAKYMKLRVCNLVRENCTVDEGRFAYYAGPIYRSFGAEMHCVSVRSTMHSPNGTVIMDHWTFIGSCN